ncbi:hypothetical protein BC829DRAFT_421244 [Chytridium lagenaria]|nr:hypothetical protein BC829DRAFT_421244 [Chytridium lagenaria]
MLDSSVHEPPCKPPGPLKLTTLASFAVGKMAPVSATEDDEAGTDDQFYDIIPDHFSSLALLQHLVELAKEFIAIPEIFSDMVGYCIHRQAFEQAFDLLCHMWSLMSNHHLVHFLWFERESRKMRKFNQWIDFISLNLTIDFIHHSAFCKYVWLSAPYTRL